MLLARLAFRGTMGGRRTGRLSGGRRAGIRGHLRGVPARTAIQKFVKDAAMITCERCQTENIEGSQYCDECGAALEPATAGGPVGRAYTSEHAGPGTEAVASDSGAAPRVSGPELRAVPKPQPLSPAGASVTGVAGRARPHEDSQSRRDPGAAPHAKLVIHRG